MVTYIARALSVHHEKLRVVEKGRRLFPAFDLGEVLPLAGDEAISIPISKDRQCMGCEERERDK